ncbi:MAG: hypothetical protein HY613_00540, partial [Candidatus Rokubacteria bacterium]|nr:hypothetical protein [Candidatus Rokubacteria bacterium]
VQSALPALRGRDVAHPDLHAYAAAWRREFLPKWRLCTLYQHAIRRPPLAEWLVARLTRRPDLTTFLMGVVGDLLPAHRLTLLALFARLVGLPARPCSRSVPRKLPLPLHPR